MDGFLDILFEVFIPIDVLYKYINIFVTIVNAVYEKFTCITMMFVLFIFLNIKYCKLY